MNDWVKEIPKAVLHDHLDGGLRPSTAKELAKQTNYKPINEIDDVANKSYTGAVTFGSNWCYFSQIKKIVKRKADDLE